MSDDLHDRVNKFQAMELPGQPMGMHMGTMYLVNDLWREVERLRTEVARLQGEPRILTSNTNSFM